ncbi:MULTISPECIES: HlyD family secretion protein [unclassified Colwellia]|uniref:HlyD family secretion protein n=1 Tax=unclassified Colwellia TaxID=196834 RepID=UPI0015F3E3A5|nr:MULTISPECIES: HlyD family efflux transporter periplasmic adaptor subunit [unclassified Colwellia]MBA6346985.1 HlyD family efflux transporter periplasmic adaptor subunit [Colwellia sp. BRX8-9]MBA6350629.1 HlyD family efflux transporter periplasmic adaptor subunit [Colwellia sp. BRX9-1]MBA6357721.1 HlyD family efflux transporter periplasmic adaptor subunit [Colwellia sp. BRX8-3]MBA6361515.1 HlyD family efflux transporter periplasmic adaptor subunit [Colwellia sp. BRX8-6]MBA6369563.1 HlyD fami|tara:strand:- start:1498 stop:2466 length:969 start_codon:yes stop_codon:yes gene_type:complete
MSTKAFATCSCLFTLFITLATLSGCDNKKPGIALGTLERERIAHTATVSEVITALPVSAGSQVTEGTILVRLDDTLQKAFVAKAQAQMQQAKANLEKVHNGARKEEVAAASAEVEGAKAALIKSEADYKRTQILIKQALSSQVTLENSLALRDENRAKLHSAQEKLLQLINGARIEDLQIAEAILATAVAVLDSENKKLNDLTITAKRDGLLDNLPWNLGERVTLGSPVAIVLAGRAPFARVYVPEPYRVKIKVADKLTVQVDGLTDSIIGTVRWISSEPAFTPYFALNQEERANLMYLAEIQLPDSAAELPMGVPAQVIMP